MTEGVAIHHYSSVHRAGVNAGDAGGEEHMETATLEFRGGRPPEKHEILSAAEEHRLVGLAQGGDHAARDRLVAANMGMIARISSRVARPPLPPEDATQEGVLGYLEGLRRFDRTRGLRLNTYALYWVRVRIQQAWHDYQRIRVTTRTGPDGEPAGVTDETRALGAAAKACQAASDLAAPRGKTWEEVFGAAPGGDDEAGMDATREADRLRDWLDLLPARDRALVALRYGLDGGGGRTLREVGLELGGVTRERTRQLEARAMKRLRECAGVAS